MLNSDIIEKILSRLPTKSIAKFRCLSKTWHNRLSTSSFTNLHLSRNETIQENLIFVTQSQSLKTITFPMKNDQVSREIQLPADKWPTFILGSCNGLVLLSCGDDMLVLNPITCKTSLCSDIISKEEDEDNLDQIYGFGYDRSCDDYKVVTLSYNRDERYAAIDVYSVRRVFSERVGYSPFDHTPPTSMVMPFVNDAVHWLTTSGIRISAFDLVNETFHEVPFPNEFKPDLFYINLVILGGCLSIVDHFKNGITDVWIMKEYGMVDSWIRFRINVNGRITPVCFVGDEELLSFTGGDSWVVYDLIDGTVKEVVGGGIPSTASFGDWGTFVDTLVYPAQYPGFQ